MHLGNTRAGPPLLFSHVYVPHQTVRSWSLFTAVSTLVSTTSSLRKCPIRDTEEMNEWKAFGIAKLLHWPVDSSIWALDPWSFPHPTGGALFAIPAFFLPCRTWFVLESTHTALCFQIHLMLSSRDGSWWVQAQHFSLHGNPLECSLKCICLGLIPSEWDSLGLGIWISWALQVILLSG